MKHINITEREKVYWTDYIDRMMSGGQLSIYYGYFGFEHYCNGALNYKRLTPFVEWLKSLGYYVHYPIRWTLRIYTEDAARKWQAEVEGNPYNKGRVVFNGRRIDYIQDGKRNRI